MWGYSPAFVVSSCIHPRGRSTGESQWHHKQSSVTAQLSPAKTEKPKWLPRRHISPKVPGKRSWSARHEPQLPQVHSIDLRPFPPEKTLNVIRSQEILCNKCVLFHISNVPGQFLFVANRFIRLFGATGVSPINRRFANIYDHENRRKCNRLRDLQSEWKNIPATPCQNPIDKKQQIAAVEPSLDAKRSRTCDWEHRGPRAGIWAQ